MKITLKPRFVLFAVALLFCAKAAFGQGEFQQTRGGKTFIWNGTPKPGETASWDGDRDKESYATGFGALTWYTANGSVYALYYGNMVHGKFEGAVNVHTNGRRAHAYFVDGGRVTGWARGPAPSKMTVPEEVIVEKRRVEAEKAAAAAAKKAALAAEAERKAKAEAERLRQAELNATKPEPKPAQPDQTPAVVGAEKPPSEPVKKESEVVAKESEAPATASQTRTFDEPTPIPTKSDIASQKSESAPLSTPEPSIPASIVSEPPREPPAAETKTEVAGGTSEATRESSSSTPRRDDVSLNALVGPPSSLRGTTESSPPKMETETSTSTSRGNAPLTEDEAINLADTEARVKGYHLDNYQRPKADHSAVKGKWSLFYGLKDPNGGGDSPLTITVEDKSKKVEIRQ